MDCAHCELECIQSSNRQDRVIELESTPVGLQSQTVDRRFNKFTKGLTGFFGQTSM